MELNSSRCEKGVVMLAVAQERAMSDQAQQCRRLARVITITKQMLVHADHDEWEQVTELEIERRDDLAACFSDAVLIAEAIAALLHLNEELMAKLKTARDVVMEQGIEYSRNRSAVGDYKAVEIAS